MSRRLRVPLVMLIAVATVAFNLCRLVCPGSIAAAPPCHQTSGPASGAQLPNTPDNDCGNGDAVLTSLTVPAHGPHYDVAVVAAGQPILISPLKGAGRSLGVGAGRYMPPRSPRIVPLRI